MKKIIIGTALAAGYIILNRLIRGYWALDGDLIVIAMATAAYLLLGKGVENDNAEDKRPTCVKISEATGALEKHVG